MLINEELQAGADIEIPIAIHLLNKKGILIAASDFVSAEFSLYTVNRENVLTKTLGSGIVVEDVNGESLFIVTLTDTDTLNLEGLYLVQFSVQDSAGTVSVPVQNELTFKPKLGV